ncbi:hypothetical protein ACR3K2_02050 [Cryptosporidium serpentis]
MSDKYNQHNPTYGQTLSNITLIADEDDDINPHIPQFIAKVPWYLTQEKKTLQHQRLVRFSEEMGCDSKVERGTKDTKPIKYRKGACTNCGASTHKVADCLERTRKRGAKWTNTDLCADEYIPQNCMKERNLDAKRDRWNDFDPRDYKSVIEEFEAMERLSKERRMKKIEKILSNDFTSSSETSVDYKHNSFNSYNLDDDTVIKDFDDKTFGNKDDKTRTTIKNLRIREDTAKYLINLDTNSAFYDPKSRSMRGNLVKDSSNFSQDIYQTSEEPLKIIKMEAFAWHKYKHGETVHLQAQPTQLEMLYKEHLSRANYEASTVRNRLTDCYGGAEYIIIKDNSRQTKVGNYFEDNNENILEHPYSWRYSSSKYVEDDYIADHLSVWGSYYDIHLKKWGFRCCRQTNRLLSCSNV